MDISSLTVRPLVSKNEYDIYYRLAANAFSRQASEENAQSWQRFVTQSPEFRAEQVRGAFRASQLLGGYTLHERMLCMGAAQISTGCIAAVVTAPDSRKQGVATALMQDAIAFARKENHVLLLLDGIPNFYFRYGYIDLFDVASVEVNCSAILAQPSTKYHVRPATVDDAPAILALYRRHSGIYTGSFERSLEIQEYRLRFAQTPPVLAISPGGVVEGYLFHGVGDETAQGREVAADTWEALLALLQYHVYLLDNDPATRTLLYFMPLDAPMMQWMIDALEVPDTSQWKSPAREWGVRGSVYHHRFAGWMGCLIDFPLLMHTILPELQARWQHSLAQWSGEFTLVVDGQTCTLRLNDADVQLVEGVHTVAYQLELTSQDLVQLVFGYRALPQLTNVSHIPGDACTALAILFPSSHTWISHTDWF